MGKPVRAVLRGRDHSNVILLPGEHIKSTDHDRMGHGDDGPLLPTTCCETVIQRGEIRVLGPHGSMRQLGQDGPEGALPTMPAVRYKKTCD